MTKLDKLMEAYILEEYPGKKPGEKPNILRPSHFVRRAKNMLLFRQESWQRDLRGKPGKPFGKPTKPKKVLGVRFFGYADENFPKKSRKNSDA